MMALSNHILLDWLKPFESLQKLRLLYQSAGPEMQWTFAAEHQFDLLLLGDPNLQIEPLFIGSDLLPQGNLIVDPHLNLDRRAGFGIL
jgi:hypothetical protein